MKMSPSFLMTREVWKTLPILMLASLWSADLAAQQKSPAEGEAKKAAALPTRAEALAKAQKMRDALMRTWKDLPTDQLLAKVQKLSAMKPENAGAAQAQKLELGRVSAAALTRLLAQRAQDPSVTPRERESLKSAVSSARQSFQAFDAAYVRTQPWAFTLPAEPAAETPPSPATPKGAESAERPINGVWTLKSVLSGRPTTLTVTVTGDTVVMKNDLTEWRGDVDWIFDDEGNKKGFELVVTGNPPLNFRRIRSPFTLDARGMPHPGTELRLYEVDADGVEKDTPLETVPQTLTSESGTPLETGGLGAGKTFGFPMVTPSSGAARGPNLSGEWDFHMKTLKASVTTPQGVMQLPKTNNSSPMKVTQVGDQVTMVASGNSALGTIKGTFDGRTLSYKQVDANGKPATYTLTLDPATGVLTGLMEHRQSGSGTNAFIQVEMKMTPR